MAYLSIVDALLAIAMLLWNRALHRSRGADIPCTARIFSPALVAVGVVALVVVVVANVLVLKALDGAFGKHLSPVLFTVWLLAMSAASILFIVAITARDINRKAVAWIRMVPPDELVVRAAGKSITVKLEPGSVRALLVGGEMGPAMYVQYFVRNGDKSIELVVSFTSAAGPATSGAPSLTGYSGLIVQGDAGKLHRHFAPFCQPHSPPA